MQPLNLMTQAAGVELEELLSEALNAPRANNIHSFVDNTVSFGVRAAADSIGLGGSPDLRQSLARFAASPSPLPRSEFSAPDPFEASGTLRPNGAAGLVFQRDQQPTDPLASLQGVSTSSVRPVGPSAAEFSQFGLETQDPFGTPDPRRAREILRMLVAGG